MKREVLGPTGCLRPATRNKMLNLHTTFNAEQPLFLGIFHDQEPSDQHPGHIIQNRSIPRPISGKVLSEIRGCLIAYTHALQRSVEKPELARSLSSLNQFIEMKERAGRERATLGVVFNQNRVDSELLSTFSRNLGEFSAYAEGFRGSADEAYVRQLDDKMAAADAMEVARLQRLILETPMGHSLDVPAESWFKLSTARIDQMSDVENALSLHICKLANQAHDHAYFVLWVVLGSVGGAVAAVTLLSYCIIRNIRAAVGEVNNVLIALSERELTSRATYEGRDEFGTIANNLNRTATELSQIIQEIGTATAQVATAAEESSAVTFQTSQSLERQRQGTELVVTAINEMSATVRDVAQSTGDAAALSQQVSQSTEKRQKRNRGDRPCHPRPVRASGSNRRHRCRAEK